MAGWLGMPNRTHNQTQPDGADCSVNARGLKPEWIRIPDAIRISGICRSAIYELINSGAIQSFSHRKRGRVLGQRLISYDSLVDYLSRAFKASTKHLNPDSRADGRGDHE